MKLNPQFAIEAAGRLPPAPVRLGYTVQYVLGSDEVSGALADRDFETRTGFTDERGVTARVTAMLPVGFTLGASWMTRGFRDDADALHHVPHVSLDADWVRGPVEVYGEWTRRADGDLPPALAGTIAGSEATYWLAGVRAHYRRLHVRYNFSRAAYDAVDRRDAIHQPGVTVDLASTVHALVEWNEWRTRTAQVTSTTDRSLNFVLLLTVP